MGWDNCLPSCFPFREWWQCRISLKVPSSFICCRPFSPASNGSVLAYVLQCTARLKQAWETWSLEKGKCPCAWLLRSCRLLWTGELLFLTAVGLRGDVLCVQGSPQSSPSFWVSQLYFMYYVRWIQTLGLAYTFCICISCIRSRHQMLASPVRYSYQSILQADFSQEAFPSSHHSRLTCAFTDFTSIFFFGTEAFRSAILGYPFSSFLFTKWILLGIYKHRERDLPLHRGCFTWHPCDKGASHGLGMELIVMLQESLTLPQWWKVMRIRPILFRLWSCWSELFLSIVSPFSGFQAWKNHFWYKPLKAYYCSEKHLQSFVNKFV